MKKLLSVLMLASIFGAGAAISAMNAGSGMGPVKPQARPANPCDACPPNWNCHVDKKTGTAVCRCVNCSGW